MSKSIMQTERECLICGDDRYLHRHHVFYGTANRSISEKWGCWVWLCPYHHNGSMNSIHANPGMDKRLKQETQKKFEELYGHDKFMQEFGRSWL